MLQIVEEVVQDLEAGHHLGTDHDLGHHLGIDRDLDHHVIGQGLDHQETDIDLDHGLLDVEGLYYLSEPFKYHLNFPRYMIF